MKRILRRSTMIFVLTVAFIGGMGYLTFQTVTNADDWVEQAFNAHMAGSGGFTQAGSIFDRDGDVLAQTVDGERMYNPDESIRKATLHVVGDNSLNISTSAQSMFRSQLTGYSFIWGLNMPQSLRNSTDITLSVDADICKAAYEVLSQYDKKGACVLYNYKTGEVVCSVSTFAYDPQAPPEITEENESEYDGVYLDNVLSSAYTPGSTFKIITTAAAYEHISDIDEHTWYCSGSKTIGGNEVTCLEAHGSMNLTEAFAYSCNIAFAEIAVEVGAENMNATAERIGINQSVIVDGLETAKGHYDVSNAETSELAWSGVGQFDNLVNPLQMAVICGSIANGGKSVNPTLLKDETSTVLDALGIKADKTQTERFSPEVASRLNETMRYTVTDYYGDYGYGGLKICAKTGTGEVGNGRAPNGWIVGYAQDEACPLAFACIVEDSGFGATYAGPVVQAAMTKAAEVFGTDG